MPAQKPQILIIEDDPSIIDILQVKFRVEGMQVLTAEDGLVGLKIAQEQQPDLILLDIIMPKMDGLTMLKKLRESGRFGKQVAVVILTNVSDVSRIQEAALHGVYDFLVKANWEPKDLVKLVRSKIKIVKEQ